MATGTAPRRSAAVTGAALLLAVALIVASAYGLRSRGEDGPPAAPAPIVARLAPLEVVGHAAVPRRFVGRVEAAQAQALAFEHAGRLTEVAVDEGDGVARGDALAALDVREIGLALEERRAGRRALEAQLELAELTAERRRALEARGASPTQAADEARLDAEGFRARIAEADAAIDGLLLDIENSVLRAPYDGRIGQRHADPGQVVAAGESVLRILEDAPPRMRVGLPPPVAETVAPGDVLAVEIDGRSVPATVLRVRPDLDPDTLTRAVVLALEAQDATAGRTGTVELAQRIEARGAWVPVGALREGERGLWTVLAVGPGESALRVVAAEVLVVDGTRAFVSGAFEPGLRIVAEGAHRLSPGQLVAGG